MKLDDYAIQQLAPYMTGHTDHGANFTGRELISIFNKYGNFRDVYANGLPPIKERTKYSKKKHTAERTVKKKMKMKVSLINKKK